MNNESVQNWFNAVPLLNMSLEKYCELHPQAEVIDCDRWYFDKIFIVQSPNSDRSLTATMLENGVTQEYLKQRGLAALLYNHPPTERELREGYAVLPVSDVDTGGERY